MQARNREVKDWFDRIRSGQLRLPRFQRGEAWDVDNVEGLLDSVLKGLPAGSALVLEIGREEPFITRPLAGAPAPKEHCTEHLLDGQQRLTALWKSLQDLYEDQVYLVRLTSDEADQGEGPPPSRVLRVYRWTHRDGRRFPLWVDSPSETYARGYVPAKLLQPDDVSAERSVWLRSAFGEDYKKIHEVGEAIRTLQERVKYFNLPLLALEVSTKPATALDVFVRMNTSAAPLTVYDIIVAQFEAKTGKSMQGLMDDLRKSVPEVTFYTTAETLVLQAAALRAGKPPTQTSVRDRDFDLAEIDAKWQEIKEGVRWALRILEEERVYDDARLPTGVVLPILVALHPHMPPHLDAAGNARSLIRSYLWRAFTTARYEAASAGRALQDYRGLRAALQSPSMRSEIPTFDDKEYPMPDEAKLRQVGWPKRKDTLARAILALSFRKGARDIADGQPVSREHLKKREYHHLFPDSLLTGPGRLSAKESSVALNCAVITMNTNRNVAAKEPLVYLSERIEKANLGEEVVRERLGTHLVPYEELRAGGYASIQNPEERSARIRKDYEAFLAARAATMLDALRSLWSGYEG